MSTLIDFPLADDSKDDLDRGLFAKLVANALLAKNTERATVIGLTGAWGTGKEYSRELRH